MIATRTAPQPVAARIGGRPRAARVPSERVLRLQALKLRRICGLKRALVAHLLDVDSRTIQRWCREAASYPEAASTAALDRAVSVEHLLARLLSPRRAS